MNASTASLSEMVNSSIAVLTRPSITTFEQYERRGTTRDALIYVGVVSAAAAILAFLFSLLGGLSAAIVALITVLASSLLNFGIFAYVLFWMGRQQGGTGTQDEVFYTCALYTAPIVAITGVIRALNAIPFVACLTWPVSLGLWIYQIYLGYLASRSSMNLDQNRAIISVVVAILAQILVGTFIFGIIIAATIGGAAASGALNG